MIRVHAASRLHFGLLSLPGEDDTPTHWPDIDAQPTIRARHFGGVGLMIEEPGVELTVVPARIWAADGPGAERALAFAHACRGALDVRHPHYVRIHRCPAEHVGLGTGTQLGLAVARGLAISNGLQMLSAEQLSESVERGKRSAIGIHGFAQGGFLVEGGKCPERRIAPLVCRHAFPDEWRVVLVMPRGVQGTHGQDETQAFLRLAGAKPRLQQTDALCRLVLLGLVPALVERDLDAFGEALHDFNARVGEMFAPWQGGLVAHPQTERLVRALRAQGIRGVGQSSWGPTTFAITHADQAPTLRDWLCREAGWGEDEVIVTRAANHGARHEVLV